MTFGNAEKKFVRKLRDTFTDDELKDAFEIYPAIDEDGVEYFYAEVPLIDEDEDPLRFNFFTNGDTTPSGYFDWTTDFLDEPVRSKYTPETGFSERYYRMWQENEALRKKILNIVLGIYFEYLANNFGVVFGGKVGPSVYEAIENLALKQIQRILNGGR